MEKIVITIDENKWFFRYLEEVAEWLGRRHSRTINIAEELEGQINGNNCYFEIDAVIYHYEQF